MTSNTESIHIIFNEFSRRTLIDNKELNINTDTIISIEDDLRVGPVPNFNSNKEIEDRKEWLSKILEKTIWAEKIISNVNSDIKKIDAILNNGKHKTFYLWTGKNALDIIGAARLITKLKKHNITLFITDFTEVTVLNKNGKSFSPKSLIEVNSCQIHTVFKHFKKLERAQLLQWEELWEKIKSNDSLLRIIDINENIKFAKETHFDNLLQSFCTSEFQKPARIVAKTLLKTDFGVPDWFLNWRLKKMTEMKKLETIGKLEDMRDYEVKITPEKSF